MPWKESSVMGTRLRFVARLLEGEPMSPLCREFGIFRKTGYKIFDRYKAHGLEALTDRSRRRAELSIGQHTAAGISRRPATGNGRPSGGVFTI